MYKKYIICFKYRKVWIDLPLSAQAPVYTDKIYVKALRCPTGLKLFKPDTKPKVDVNKKAKEVPIK